MSSTTHMIIYQDLWDGLITSYWHKLSSKTQTMILQYTGEYLINIIIKIMSSKTYWVIISGPVRLSYDITFKCSLKIDVLA